MGSFNKQIGGSHYLGWKIQPMEYFIANKIPTPEGDIIQYFLRQKGNRKEDLEKAKHIIDMLIESLDHEPNQP